MPIGTTPSGTVGEFSTYTPIYSQTLTSTASSVTFSNIPTTFTDLVLIVSGRGTRTSANIVDGFIRFNNDSGSNYSTTHLYGDGSTAGSDRVTSRTEAYLSYWFPTATTTSGIFSSTTLHIQNYSNTTTYKTLISKDGSQSNTNGLPGASVSLWRSTSPITSINVFLTPNDWAIGSTFTLYGIKAAAPAPKATGGDLVYTDNTYWYHVFNNSGIFDVKTAMNVDYLVVAGGGSGGMGSSGGSYAGGGGAGGMRSTVTATGGGGSLESQLSVTPIQYAVTVGAGGAAVTTAAVGGNSGTNSTFATITSTGGGGGGSFSNVAKNGGSGGGGAEAGGGAVGTGISGQGYNGGAYAGVGYAGGGGGAGSVGASTSPNPSAGGSGVATSISGTSTTYATGGKGGIVATVNGTTNTGGGGDGKAGSSGTSGAGGSGVVIVRYAV